MSDKIMDLSDKIMDLSDKIMDLKVELKIAEGLARRFSEASSDWVFQTLDTHREPGTYKGEEWMARARYCKVQAKEFAKQTVAIQADIHAALRAARDGPPRAELTEDQIDQIKEKLSVSPPRWRWETRSQMWAGRAIAETLGWDVSGQKKQIERYLQELLAERVLKTITGIDHHRQDRLFVVPFDMMEEPAK